MNIKDWMATQDVNQYPTLRSIKKVRNAERQNALDCEKFRPPCPDPNTPLKSEMGAYFDLVWLGQERNS